MKNLLGSLLGSHVFLASATVVSLAHAQTSGAPTTAGPSSAATAPATSSAPGTSSAPSAATPPATAAPVPSPLPPPPTPGATTPAGGDPRVQPPAAPTEAQPSSVAPPAGASAAFPVEPSSSPAPAPEASSGGATSAPAGTAPTATPQPVVAAAAAPVAAKEPATATSAFGQPWDSASLAVDRRLETPAEYVDRALTQPEGTLSLSFANYNAFSGTSQSVGWVPVFAFGITSDVEFSASAPLRYDEGLGDWTYLDPIGELTFKVVESEGWEAGLRVGVLLPVTSNAGAAVRLGVPVLLRLTDVLRLDAAAELMWTFEKPKSAGVRVPVGLTWQPASWLFTGFGAAPNVGVGGRSKTSVDPFALLGVTLGARERAQMDISARVFIENLGAGEGDESWDGVGAVITAGFFPDIY